MIRINKSFWLLVSILILVDVFFLLPEAIKERISVCDGALFSANGAFFLSAFKDLSNVISSPATWMWDYYHQYPALFIRRHPPILSLAESVMFAMFGISAVTAKLTILLFSISWIIGWFFALRKMFKNEFFAFFATLLMLTLPKSVSLGSLVHADIPSMTFFAWGCYFFTCYSESAEKKHKYAILTALLLSCSLYTYQLPMFGIIALILYILMTDWTNFFKRSDFYSGAILFVLLVIPLVIFTLKFAPDNVSGIVNEPNKDFVDFIPVKSKWSLENWVFYLTILWKYYPLPTIGLILWGITKMSVPIRKYELFFFMWILIGYISFSIIPSKGPRYAYHFIIAALPLTVIGIRDGLRLLTKKWFSERHLTAFSTIIFLILFSWNISGIPQAKSPYAQGIDRVTHSILSEDKSARILYSGAFESGFIFYIRKYDTNRMAMVFRSANELNEPEKLSEDLVNHQINFIVFESENLRENELDGIYDRYYIKIQNIITDKKRFQKYGDFKILWGRPNNEMDIYLRVYKVG